MASSFERLPSEIYDMIIEACRHEWFLDYYDIDEDTDHNDDWRCCFLHWSATSRFFRSLLLPKILPMLHSRNLTSSTRASSARGLAMLADSELACHVKVLNYLGKTDCICNSIRETDQWQFQDPPFSMSCSMKNDKVLLDEVRHVLSNLHKFPNLKRLRLRFEVPWSFAQVFFDDICNNTTET